MLRVGMFLSNRYEIIGKIGSGGMSDVYKAKCHKLNRFVAIKVLKSEFSADQNFVSKFRMEAQNAACLSHPNIVSVYDVGEDQGVYYIVMELIEGITLKKYIERKKKLEIRESIEIAMQVARGIEAAHNQHIVHRDIKPQNIMISMEGKVKVTDFGIARAASTQTISSNTMGSVHYISPEQARGGYCNEKSDIYSLGITLYEMLTGRVPFEGDSTVSVALLHIQGEMVPPRQYEPLIPISLEKIILKCTQKKPELRYASATELIDDLKKSLTMPNEDFVKIASLNSDSPTMIFTGEDIDEIKRKSSESMDDDYDNDYDDDYDDEYDDDDHYDRRYDDRHYDDRRSDRWEQDRDNRYYDDEYEDDYDDDYDEEDEDKHSKIEKIITGISIGVAIIIVIIAAVLILKGCGITQNAKETQETAETLESSEDQVAMINLLGKTKDEAVSLLKGMNLKYKVETGTSDIYEEGQVFEQEFKEGKMLDIGTVVTIKVSVGNETAVVPNNLAGKTIEEATSLIKSVGLKVSSQIEKQNSDDIEEGLVIDANPSMGNPASVNQPVILIVSEGPAVVEVKVPNIVNLTEASAINRLEESGLKAGKITYESSDSVSAGRVIRQNTEAGKKVEENSEVSFVVSEGSSMTTVPDLRFSSLSDAKDALNEAGLKVGSVDEEYSDESSKGLVIGQSIPEGRSVERGTAVDITIGKGAEPTQPASQTYEDSGDPDDQPTKAD
ncbi:MAG: Stk1 family PASTA domain-containing Ser/Thr kinase [Clostridiales bacterium]|nr:Stk1 family PASTA domain-containing Ser/Thr kinase [Clostridiales bacterium]